MVAEARMESIPIGILVVPSIAALLLFAVFSYLYLQSREPYFRAWQFAWAAYCGYWALALWNYFEGWALPTAGFRGCCWRRPRCASSFRRASCSPPPG